jgi:general secretion pathway protein H
MTLLKRRPAHGFTLLEIMLVLAVMSVMTGMLLVSLGDNAARQLDREAGRLQLVLDMATDEAVMQGLEFSLALVSDDVNSTEGYQFLFLNPENQRWTALTEKPFFYHPLDASVSMDISLREESDNPLFGQQAALMRSLNKTQSLVPSLLLLSSGELTPFVITLRHKDLRDPVSIGSDGISGVELF